MKPQISYLPQKSIDRAKWDACIAQSVNGLVYGESWFLDVVCNNWDALILGDYEAVFPLPFNSKYGLSYSLQPLFCQQLGLFVKSEVHLSLLPDFIAAIPKKFLLVKLNLNTANSGIPNTKPRVNFIIDLKEGYETIRKKFSAERRREIRKSTENGTTLKTGISTNELMELVLLNIGDRSILRTDQFSMMHRLMDVALLQDSLETIGIYDEEGTLCAAAGFIKDQKRLYYVFGGASSKGRKMYANVRIVDHIIATNTGQNIVLDFEGSELPAVAGFFRHFGPVETHYYLYERNLLPWPLNKLIK